VVDLDATLGDKLFEVPDNPYRRYQRTAAKITSGGKRKPVNPKGTLTGGLRPGVRFTKPPTLARVRCVNATEPVEAFSASLRNEWDLIPVGDDLRTVVRDTQQSSNVSLWLWR